MPDFEKKFDELEAFLLDMDGVMFIGDSPIEGSKEAIQFLREKGKKLIFLTNNSTKTREKYERDLSDIGLDVDVSEIVTSAYSTAVFLEEEEAEDKTCYVIGEDGLKSELQNIGFEILPKPESEEASYVVVGMDRGLTYEKVWAAPSAILSGAEFIASNPDPTYPTERGLAPGAGASIGAVSGAVEEEPFRVIGKPSPYMLKIALDNLGVSPENAAMVGDRLDMDIKAGNEAGLTTVFVLSGVDSEGDLDPVEDSSKQPDYVFPSLSSIMNM